MAEKKYLVTLAKDEETLLRDILSKGKHAAQKRKRAQALLLAHEGYTGEAIAERVGMHRRGIEGLRQRFVEDGFETTLEGKKRGHGTGGAMSRPAKSTALSGSQKQAPGFAALPGNRAAAVFLHFFGGGGSRRLPRLAAFAALPGNRAAAAFLHFFGGGGSRRLPRLAAFAALPGNRAAAAFLHFFGGGGSRTRVPIRETQTSTGLAVHWIVGTGLAVRRAACPYYGKILPLEVRTRRWASPDCDAEAIPQSGGTVPRDYAAKA